MSEHSTPSIPKINGRVVWKALGDLQEPSSSFTVTTYIAAALAINPYGIRRKVVEILDGGVRYGFIRKHQNLYYIPEVAEAIKSFKKNSGLDTNSLSSTVQK